MKNYDGLKIRKLLIFFSTVALLYLSLWLTLLIRYQGNYNPELWQLHLMPFSLLFLIWLLIFYSFNLFEPVVNQSGVQFLNQYLKASLINLGLSFIYFYAFYAGEIKPRTVLLILLAVFTLFYSVWRKLFSRVGYTKKLSPALLFIGYEPLIKEILPSKPDIFRFGYTFKGIVTNQPLDERELNLKKYNFSELGEVVKKEKISLLVINEPGNQEITDHLFQILPLRVNFVTLTKFYENITYRVPLKIINRGWFLDNFSEGDKTLYEALKRLGDLLLALIIGILSLPLCPILALAVNLSSKGPVIFKQERIGQDGRPFMALKFRTMYQNAEKSGPSWAKENDPRITKAGLFLRKTRLDEIPQLINIFKGEMSFVGPRPERPEFISELEKEIPFYRERLLVKPGLTGWAQINFPYADSIDSTLKKLQYDLYYIKNRSIFLDFSIILKTLNIVLKNSGR